MPGIFNVASMTSTRDAVLGLHIRRDYKGQMDLRAERIMTPEWVAEEDAAIE